MSENVKSHSETAHSPLPWSWAYTGPVMKGYSQPVGISSQLVPGFTLVAGCFGDVQGGEPTAHANAQFIIKAVNCHAELLSALEKCEEVIGMARLQGKLSNNALSPVNDALVAARKAIDNARIDK